MDLPTPEKGNWRGYHQTLADNFAFVLFSSKFPFQSPIRVEFRCTKGETMQPIQEFKNYINGEWVRSSSGNSFENRNPANHQQILESSLSLIQRMLNKLLALLATLSAMASDPRSAEG